MDNEDIDENELYYSDNTNEDENTIYEKETVNDIYEYDEKVISIFKDIKEYVKNENIFICEMLKLEDIYSILEE